MVHVVAGPRVSSYTEEGFALALTHFGDVYSWGKGYKGRLGHSTAENIRTPKIIDALSKDIKMVGLKGPCQLILGDYVVLKSLILRPLMLHFWAFPRLPAVTIILLPSLQLGVS